jgi:tetratricopeptide (TPR) repeat protein
MCEELRTLASRRNVICVGAILANFVFAAALAPKAGAQTSSFAPTTKSRSIVSIKELRIPPRAQSEFQEGLERLQKRDPRGSLVHFTAALEKYPDYYEVYYHKGIAETELGEYDNALQSFQKAIDLSEGRYARAEFGYGLALCRMGRAADAERIVRHGLQTEPNISDGHVVLGYALLELNRLDEAEKSAREALELNDVGSAKGYLILAEVEGGRGNYRQQVQYLDAYLKSRPNDPNKSMLKIARDVAKRLASKTKFNSPQMAVQTTP